MQKRDLKLQNKRPKKEERDKLLVCLLFLIFLFAACTNKDQAPVAENGIEIKISQHDDIKIERVYDDGQLVYEKIQRDSLIQVSTFDPIFSRITGRYDYSSSTTNSFYSETASRFKEDNESGELLYKTYCSSCHKKGSISELGSVGLSFEDFSNGSVHEELLKYKFDSNDLMNIFNADSIGMY